MNRLTILLLTMVLLVGCSAGRPATAPTDSGGSHRSQLVSGVGSPSTPEYTPPNLSVQEYVQQIKKQWTRVSAYSPEDVERNNGFNNIYDDWLEAIDKEQVTNDQLEKYTGLKLCDILQSGYQAAFDIGNGTNIKAKRQAMTYWKCPNVPH